MLRLFLNKDKFYFNAGSEDNLLFLAEDIEENGIIEKKKTPDILKADSIISSAKTVKHYLEFIKTIRTETAKKLPSEFLTVYSEGSLYIFVSQMLTRYYKVLCKYEIESDSIKNFVMNLYGFTDDKNFVSFVSSFENHFAYITTWQVLQLLFTKADIEGSGEEMYSFFKIPKKSGGMRDIVAPHEKIKASLVDLNHLLQRVYDNRNSSFQIAYKKGKNVKDGAKLHADKKYVFNIDLKDFYPSCKREIVKKYTDFLFAYSYNRKFLEEQFFDVILIDDGLFIGSPVSGTLANVAISNAVLYMNNICKKHGMKLSVYADDISFSSDKFIVKEYIVKLFNEAFTKYGLDSYYTLNEKKCVGFSGCNRKVTGVSINNDNKITIPRKYYRDLRVQIDHLAKGDIGIDVRILRGKIAYASMIDDSGKIYNYLMKYKDTVDKFNLCSEEKLEELKKRAGI